MLRCALLSLFLFVSYLQSQDKPNFVWILSEDNSPHFYDSYFKGGAKTPTIDSLAKDGLFFENAFSCAPVCSVARTTLITSCYGPRIGTQYHRRSAMSPLPGNLTFFPAYLKKAGYYTTNNSKTDYNATTVDKGWDKMTKGHWKNRPEGAPFFAKFTYGKSHESSLHRNVMKPVHKAADMKVFPYFPNTELFRSTHATYLDRIVDNDKFVKGILDQLRKDGLLESTFIFYFGDHGGVMPRSKGYIYETGLQVPLVVRIPAKFKHLVDADRGTRVKGFVEFIDLGPTLLSLAGVDQPKGVDGRPFLGKDIKMSEVNKRDETFGYADRFDEKYELCRSLRKGNIKYKRNYEGYWPDGLMNNYRYKQASWGEWLKLWKEGKLNDVQKAFFEAKPPEELYDISKDPHEINNLAADPAFAETLKDMRQRLLKRLKGMPDLSFYPEHVLTSAENFKNPTKFGQEKKAEIAILIDTADLALLPFADAESKIKAALKSANPWIRYWALTAASNFGKKASSLKDSVTFLLKDKELLNQVRAAEFLAINGVDTQSTIKEALKNSKNYTETLNILNTVVFLRDFHGYKFDFPKSVVNDKKGWNSDRLKYLKWK